MNKHLSCKSTNERIPTGTREWADYNVNCVKGCYNDCKYCYATIMARRFGRASKETWKNMIVRDDIVNKHFKKYPGRVMFPSSHDIIDLPEVEEACFSVLEGLLKSNNEVLITTKPRYKIIKKIDRNFSDFKENFQFRFTITSKDNQLLKFWEPNAPLFEERMKSLMFSFNKGYKTSVSIEPFLDYDPVYLVDSISPFCTESIWIGLMNYIPRMGIKMDEIPFYDEIRKNYSQENLKEIYAKLVEKPRIRWKDSIRKRIFKQNVKPILKSPI
jgi:DNA repair photolyase